MLLMLNNFRSSEDRPYLSRAIAVGAAMMMIAGAMSAFPNTLKAFGFDPGVCSVLIFIFTAVWMVWMIGMAEQQRLNMVARYEGYLRTQNVESIVLCCNSPEYDEESRAAMQKYLNENHKGWSIRTA